LRRFVRGDFQIDAMKVMLSMQPRPSQFPERVRNLFNERADACGRKYRARGRWTWRLGEFSDALDEFVPAPAKVLDFGCGTGHLAQHLHQQRYAVSACDLADEMIAKARREFGNTHIKWMCLPTHWRRLPLADGAFDAVVASSVLEYVEDVELVLSELARVLRPGGVLICNVPNAGNGRRKGESWAMRLMRRKWTRQTLCTIPRVRRYLRYLELSKNRFPLSEWESGARRQGFDRLHRTSFFPTSRPLFMFSWQKETNV
jgi:ubiquinone/menaquinone biosynthesis C-methylase UbiE